MGRFSLVLCFFLASAGQIDEYLLQRGWSENYVRSFMEAIFPVDTWTSLNQLMSDNDQFFMDLAEEMPDCPLESLRADLVMGSAPSAWRSGSFPAQVPRHSGLKRSAPGDIGVARCAKTRGFFELARDADRLRDAITALNDDMYALRTWAAMDSQVKLYVGYCEVVTPPIRPFPVSVESLRGFCAAMKARSYRSVPQYVSGIFRYERLMFPRHDPVEVQAVRSAASMFVKSATRGLGDDVHRDPITIEHLFQMRDSGLIYSEKYRFYFMLSVVQFFYLLRSAEVLEIAPAHCVFRYLDRLGGVEGLVPAVKLLVSGSKTNHRSRTIYRGHECVCGSSVHDLPICPVHSLVWLRKVSGLPFDSSEPFSIPLGAGRGRSIPQYQSYLRFIKTMVLGLGLVGVFATHSLRRGGCQALCLAGWTRDEIKLYGRWLSDAIDVYLLDAPLLVSSLQMARSMITRIRGGSGSAAEFSKAPRIGEPFLGRPVQAVRWELGLLCQLYLPEAVPDRDDDVFGPSSAWCEMRVVALDPRPSQVPADAAFHRSVKLSPDGQAFLPAFLHDASRLLAFCPDGGGAWLIADVAELSAIR